jgi:HD-GYP domain-containing protein (c-di-GMP phosphodiesterase class II)
MKQRVERYQLSVGEPLPWDAYTLEGKLLLRHGQTIDSERAIDRLVEEGLFIEHDGAAAHDSERPPEEKPSALQHIIDARRALTGIYSQRLDEGNDFPSRIQRVVDSVLNACATHARVSLSSILLVQDKNYSVKHPIDVALVAKNLAEALSLEAEAQRTIVAAAITMNIGMIEVEEKIQQLQGPLNDKLLAMIRMHPEAGAKRLEKLGVTEEEWLTIVGQHHEHHDGSGYPSGCSGDAIALGARLVGVADSYCAMISGHAYRPPQKPTTAIRDLCIKHGQTIDKAVAGSLIQVLGPYPVGTLVRLVTSEIGVVTGPGEGPNTPEVHAIIARSGMALEVASHRKTHLPKFAIEDVMTIDKLGVPVRMTSLWGKDAKIS